MRRSTRHKAILDILRLKRIGSQSELASLLRENGFSVTQASVSRDLDELGVVKVKGTYTRPSEVATVNSLGISHVETAGDSLIVIRCPPGMASALAVRIDGANDERIVGTIAGDDTVFVAVDGKVAQKRVVASIVDTLQK